MRQIPISEYEFKEITERVKRDVERDNLHINQMALPQFIEVDGFSPLDDIFKSKPKAIKERFDLPADGNQVIYLFQIKEPISYETLNFLAENLKYIKKIDNDGHTQITTIKSRGWESFPIEKGNGVIYLGTSKSLAKRLEDHVGHGSKGTATIMLRKWKLVQEGKIHICFGYYNFGQDISSDLLKRIEHSLSEKLIPLIGHNRKA